MKNNFLIYILILLFFSCKQSNQELDNASIKGNDSLKIDSLKIISDTNITLPKNSEKSFTFECGSGCAMTYDEISRKKNKGSYELKYKVTQYVNEKIEDEYFETYVFEQNINGRLESIHLLGKDENILLDESSLIKNKFKEIGSIFFRDDNLDTSQQSTIKFVVEEKPYKLLEVPFDLKKYIDNLPQKIKNSYNPSNGLIDYLVKNGYEGENYSCNFLKISEKSSDLLVSISRGDSQYFLIIKSDNTKFLSYKEIGSIGEETKYFRIDNNYDVK